MMTTKFKGLVKPKKLCKDFVVSRGQAAGTRLFAKDVQLPFEQELGYLHDNSAGVILDLHTLYISTFPGVKGKFVLPNIYWGNTSLIVFDPKGEYLYESKGYLKEKGYKIITFDFCQKLKEVPDLSVLDHIGDELTALFIIISDVEASPVQTRFGAALWKYLAEKPRGPIHTHVILGDLFVIGGLPEAKYFSKFADNNISVTLQIHTVKMLTEEPYKYDHYVPKEYYPDLDEICSYFGIFVIGTLRDKDTEVFARKLLYTAGVDVTETYLEYKDINEIFVLIRNKKPCLTKNVYTYKDYEDILKKCLKQNFS